MCCVLGQDTLFSQCPSLQEYNWVLVNCQNVEVICDGPESHPVGVAIPLDASEYRNRDNLWRRLCHTPPPKKKNKQTNKQTKTSQDNFGSLPRPGNFSVEAEVDEP